MFVLLLVKKSYNFQAVTFWLSAWDYRNRTDDLL